MIRQMSSFQFRALLPFFCVLLGLTTAACVERFEGVSEGEACYAELRRHLESKNLSAATRGDFQLAMQLCSVRQMADAKLLLEKQNSHRRASNETFERECVPTWGCRCHNHRYEELFARRNVKSHRMPVCSLTPKFPVFDGRGAVQFSRRGP